MPVLAEWKPDDVLKAIALVGAAIAFGTGYFTAIQPSVAIVSGCVVGIALLASVWRHLRE